MSEHASVTISTKSWHYKWIKLVISQKLMPTPETMHNLCPYFWILIFSMLVSPIVLPIKYVMMVLKSIYGVFKKGMNKYIIAPRVKVWLNNLDDLGAYSLRLTNSSGNFWSRIYYDDNIFYKWFENKYGVPCTTGDYQKTPEYSAWLEKWSDEYWKYENDQEKIALEELRQRHQKQIKFEQYLEKYRGKIGSWFKKCKEELYSLKSVIKWTKRTMGLIITSVGLLATYFLVNIISRFVLYVISVWTWKATETTGLGLFTVIVAILIGFIISKISNFFAGKDRNIWYVNALYWAAWPLKAIFYYLLWKIILESLYYLVISGSKELWSGFLSFLGIFGEYFGASYSDVCPGLEWTENEEKDMNR